MNNGTVSFTKVGSDEVLYEMPYASASYAFIRARLNKAGNTSFDGNLDAMANYAMLFIAELNGKKLADLPDIKSVTPDDVFGALLGIDIDIEQPVSDENEGPIDENPTGTKGARS